MDPTDTSSEQQQTDPEERQPSREEAALAERFLGQINKRLRSREWKRYVEEIKLNRQYVRGLQGRNKEDLGDADDDGDDEGIVRANFIHPEVSKAVAEGYAKDPEFSVVPTEAASPERYPVWKQFGTTLEVILQSQLSPAQANLKDAAKRSFRSAHTTGFGWLKAVYQKDVVTDPIVTNRIQDAQDEIQRLDKLISDVQQAPEQSDLKTHLARREELQQQMNGMQQRKEVVKHIGMTLSCRRSERVLFSDDAESPEDLLNGSVEWITDEIWMTVDRAKQHFGFVPKAATRFSRRETNKEAAQGTRSISDKPDPGDELVCIYEMWRLDSRMVYTMMHGYKGWIRDPFAPRAIGERFYAFFPLFFDPVDGSAFPLPLVSQLRSLQDEHTTARTNFREHRERSIPFNVIHGGVISVDNAKKLTNPRFMETVEIGDEEVQNRNVSDFFYPVRPPPIDPKVYDTEYIRVDWERVTQRGDSARGTVAKAKTAAEAEILQQNLNVDTSESQDTLEDWLQRIAQYTAEVCLQEMTPDMVKAIAGEGAKWPQIPRSEIFNLVQLRIRSGSTGKPNKGLELQKWTQLLPTLKDTLMSIVELTNNGQTQQADILVTLLRMTLEKADERLDLRELLPEKTPEEKQADKQKQQQGEQQQQQAIALKMREVISNIANKDASTIDLLAQAEAADVDKQLDFYLRIFEYLQKRDEALLAGGQPPAPPATPAGPGAAATPATPAPSAPAAPGAAAGQTPNPRLQ